MFYAKCVSVRSEYQNLMDFVRQGRQSVSNGEAWTVLYNRSNKWNKNKPV